MTNTLSSTILFSRTSDSAVFSNCKRAHC